MLRAMPQALCHGALGTRKIKKKKKNESPVFVVSGPADNRQRLAVNRPWQAFRGMGRVREGHSATLSPLPTPHPGSLLRPSPPVTTTISLLTPSPRHYCTACTNRPPRPCYHPHPQ